MKPAAPETPSAILSRIFPSNEALQPANPWLRHVFPERFPFDPSDMTRDALQVQLETLIGAISAAVIKQHGTDRQTADSAGANMLMGEALALQRQHAPKGYQAMLTSLVTHDPIMSELRSDLLSEVRKAGKQGFRRGALLCAVATAIGSLAGILAVFQAS